MKQNEPDAKTTKDPRFKGMADDVGIPQQFALPKAFQTTNFVCCLAFLLLVCLRKRAFDTASKQKSLSLS